MEDSSENGIGEFVFGLSLKAGRKYATLGGLYNARR